MNCLSIVIPVYNAVDFIVDRLTALLAHLPETVEIVIVDDGSTDESLELCNTILKGRSNTCIIHQENQGLSCARNRGIKSAHGEFILFLDCDDCLVVGSIPPILELLEKSQFDVLMGKYLLSTSAGIRPSTKYFFRNTCNEPLLYIYRDLPDIIWNAWRYICRKSFIIEYSLWFKPGIYCEDVEWTPRMLESATSICFWDEPFYIYYHRPGSITKSVNFKKTLDLNHTIVNYLQKYSGNIYSPFLFSRLIRESFYSISDYCFFSEEERGILRDIICSIAFYYNKYGSSLAKLFVNSQPFIPIVLWSWMLAGVKRLHHFINY